MKIFKMGIHVNDPVFVVDEDGVRYELETLADIYPIARSLTHGEFQGLCEDIYNDESLRDAIAEHIQELVVQFLERLEILDKEGKR